MYFPRHQLNIICWSTKGRIHVCILLVILSVCVCVFVCYLKKLSVHSLTLLPSLIHFVGSFSSQRQSMNSLLALSHWDPKWWAAAFKGADDTVIWAKTENKKLNEHIIFMINQAEMFITSLWQNLRNTVHWWSANGAIVSSL